MRRRRVGARGCPGRPRPRSLAAGAARPAEETSAGLAAPVPRRRYRTSTQKLTFVLKPLELILVPQMRARHYVNARDPSVYRAIPQPRKKGQPPGGTAGNGHHRPCHRTWNLALGCTGSTTKPPSTTITGELPDLAW